MAEDKWYSVALPLLEEIARIEETEYQVTVKDLSDRLQLRPALVDVELERLISEGFIEGRISRAVSGLPEHAGLVGFHLGERGARAVEAWPGEDPFEALVALLEERLADPTVDQDTKSKLKSMLDAMVDMGKSTASALLVAFLKGRLGLHG